MNNIFNIDLSMFDEVMNTTGSTGLSDAMKTYYSDYIIDNAKPLLVHDQWAQKHPIPKNKGKVIEFRRYDPLPRAVTPIVEGKTPDGQSMSLSTLKATVKQYGDYIKLTDILNMTAIDNTLVWATKLLGQQAGETLDYITREVLNSGTNVQYAEGQVNSRHLLTGGEASGNHYLTVLGIKKAVRTLKKFKAKKIEGSYIGIINQDTAFDITNDPKFEEWHKYAQPEELYSGEIGKIAGVRFVETTEAKIFGAKDLSAANRNLTVASVSGKIFTISQTLTSEDITALISRNIVVKGYLYTVESATSNTITVIETIEGSPTSGEVVYPGEAGAKGRSVYSTIILGDDAYGTTELEGGGLEMIVKPLGSGDDPLNQRATSGWKATKVTELLVDSYLVRLETASTFNEASN